MKEQKEQKEPTRKRVPLWLVLGLSVAVAIIVIPLVRGSSSTSSEDVSLRVFAQEVEDVEGAKVTVRGDKLTLERPDGSSIESRKEEGTSALETLQQLGVSAEALSEIEIEVKGTGGGFGSVLIAIISLAPLLLFLGIGYMIFRQFRNASGGMMGIGKSKPRLIGAGGAQSGVSFDDVAGVDEAKLELAEVVEFLKTPDRFTRLGARVPKGVLLVGPPGTGKTLLARAVAGEAAVPFFSISGSEFVELFVGAGASRVRDLFAKAKEAAPAIIFVDEIDAVGRRRGIGIGGGNDEREQTLNQILVEMDGFETSTNVIVIAATNRADVLDPALLRAGRFDRRVMVEAPDVAGREAILRVHAKGKAMAEDADLVAIAKLSAGFTGADLENLLNEAAIRAARNGAAAIGRRELDEAFERLIAGPERSKNILNAQERRVVAYHEAGHAIVMESLPNTDPVHKMSIASRGGALGYTMPLPERDKVLRTREALEDEIASLVGGRTAEELFCGQITTGAANDLQRATAIAKSIVTEYGMAEDLGLRVFTKQEGAFPDWGVPQRDYAEGTALKIDNEIRGLLDRAHERARTVLRERWGTLLGLVAALLEKETLVREEIEALLAGEVKTTEVPCAEPTAV